MGNAVAQIGMSLAKLEIDRLENSAENSESSGAEALSGERLDVGPEGPAPEEEPKNHVQPQHIGPVEETPRRTASEGHPYKTNPTTPTHSGHA